MDLSKGAAKLATSAVAIVPSHHRRPRVRNVNIDARMPQPDRAPAGEHRVADGLDQVRFNRALRSLTLNSAELSSAVEFSRSAYDRRLVHRQARLRDRSRVSSRMPAATSTPRAWCCTPTTANRCAPLLSSQRRNGWESYRPSVAPTSQTPIPTLRRSSALSSTPPAYPRLPFESLACAR